ncbi:hypothetical protein GURASL_17110 [Geotalea uraniireducens]|uniref:DUF4878 domain-containing protein n=1 Tax=Geotalea uraniireducens TaxID=351604 RepID=A0ABM8EK13_9BACT|nr:hypothetical protein [Geotalea uraniireducens]BDV42788.1 hypothetical protein GURASL_17110 [Geotalea uraniireducens]
MGWRKGLTLLACFAAIALGGCSTGVNNGSGSTSGGSTPQAALDRYFSTAVKQDYAATYDCYYQRYRDKVTKDDFVKHRAEASVLSSYEITSLRQNGDSAEAVALLTFAPSAKLHRSKPTTVRVTEQLVRENGAWKIKVW